MDYNKIAINIIQQILADSYTSEGRNADYLEGVIDSIQAVITACDDMNDQRKE